MMETVIVQEIKSTIKKLSEMHKTFTQTQILTESLLHCNCKILFQDKHIDLKQLLELFCEYVRSNYAHIDISNVFEYNIDKIDSSYGFELYLDIAPHTIIPLLICCINRTHDYVYTFDPHDENNLKYESPKMCSNIYRAIYFLVVEKECICHKEYSDFIKEIIYQMLVWDYDSDDSYRRPDGRNRYPKYVYKYLRSLLYLFKHNKNIVNIQKKSINRFVQHRKQTRAAIIIQRSWRNVISDPRHLICRKRLLYEFETLVF